MIRKGTKQCLKMQRDPEDIPQVRTTPVANPVEPIPSPVAPDESEGGRYQCKICGQIFTNQADLTQHMRAHEVSGDGAGKGEGRPAGVA